MDFGFTKSILNASFFPALDMWFSGANYINYYYFGHTVLALLTKLSSLDLTITFNLMLATLFAFTATLSFSITYQLTKKIPWAIITAYVVTLGGNLQTIYAFTKGYTGDNPPPFWTIFTGKLDPAYWYANATRFVPFSIHEFPSYSFVVSDVHGHVLSLPFVLLAFALIVLVFVQKKLTPVLAVCFGLLTSILLMTNALDGPIYLGLFLLLLLLPHIKLKTKIVTAAIVVTTAVLASLPFLSSFKSFVTGVAVNCPPAPLANSQYGPLLFESTEKCQKTPFWMLVILWGFFLYCGIWYFATHPPRENRFMFGVFIFCLGLIGFAEFFYFKDIYPLHFRSNTMFKLGYQAFIMLGILSGVAMAKIKNRMFLAGLVPLLLLVSVYPYFSVRSYFGNLKNYQGLDGVSWLKTQYPNDYSAITWLDRNIPPQAIVVEADGDSYTDYARVSTFTGRQTVVGWAVHEWLWRGSYDVVAPRREDVKQIYESPDLGLTKSLLTKYGVDYIFVGDIEKQKYPNMVLSKFPLLGKEVYRAGQTTVFAVSP